MNRLKKTRVVYISPKLYPVNQILKWTMKLLNSMITLVWELKKIIIFIEL